jgi:hypothetical protein
MIYSLRGAAFTMAAMALFGGYSAINRSVNWTGAKATISYIDRSCDFIETTTDESGRKTARGTTDACSSTDEWEKVRAKRNKVVSGRATVHVTYAAPQDGSYQSGEFKLTGRDDEFYNLKAGDEVRILVSTSDPAKIRKA